MAIRREFGHSPTLSIDSRSVYLHFVDARDPHPAEIDWVTNGPLLSPGLGDPSGKVSRRRQRHRISGETSGSHHPTSRGERRMNEFEWDPSNEAENLRKHGTDFTTASWIWRGPVLERVDDRRDYGEVRILAFGAVDGRLMAVLFTRRRANRRIISARKANQREQRRFDEEIGTNDGPPAN